MASFAPEAPVGFVSPHLDDVALSCAYYLRNHPGAMVITALAGAPDIVKHTGWNARTTGETYASDAVEVRRAEDMAAMRTLQATPNHLDLLDGTYLGRWRGRDERPIADAIGRALVGQTICSLVVPLGVRHRDHVAVSNASLRAGREAGLKLYLYQDVPYAQEYPKDVENRLRRLGEYGLQLEELEPVEGTDRLKDSVFGMYRSQYGPIRRSFQSFDRAMSAPERYWRVLSQPG